jgi:hypothetical protein
LVIPHLHHLLLSDRERTCRVTVSGRQQRVDDAVPVAHCADRLEKRVGLGIETPEQVSPNVAAKSSTCSTRRTLRRTASFHVRWQNAVCCQRAREVTRS